MRMRADGPARSLLRMTGLVGAAVAALAAPARAQAPPKPAGPPPPLSRFFPRQNLVVYAEFDGLDAHRAAWEKTAACRMLNETTTGVMLEQTLARLLDELFLNVDDAPVRGRELVGLGEHLLRAGFAIGINRAGGEGPPRSFGLVIRGGARGQPRAILDRFLGDGEDPKSPFKRVQKPGGRTVVIVSDSPRAALAWWAEGDDLAISVVSPSGVNAMIAALDGREPDATEHPTRRALVKGDDAAGLEPVGLAFFEMAALPPLPREAVALGLDRIRRFDYRWGFRGRAIETIVGAVVPSPRTGISALFDQPALDVRRLPPLPVGARGFTVLSLDAARLYDQISQALKAIDPTAARPMAEFEAAAQQALGMSLRQDLLAPLGSRITLYNLPATIDAPVNLIEGVARALVLAPKSAVVLEIKDRDATARALAKLAGHAGQKTTLARGSPSPGVTTTVSLTVSPMQPLKGPDTGYLFSSSTTSFPLPAGMRPTLLLGRDELVFGTTIATARRARDLHERNQPGLPAGDPLAEALNSLPDRLTFLSVSDARRSILPDLIVGVPDLAELFLAQRQFSLLGLANLLGSSFSGEIPPFVPPPQLAVPPGAVPAPVVPLPPPGPIPVPDGENPKGPASTPAFDPERIPEADDLRHFLFPSVSALAVDDRGIRFITREAFPTINPATAVPVAIAMLVPAAHSSRVAAQRSQSEMNLKQIALGLHNFHASNNHFPTDIRGKDGKPLLSWRVRILPFIEQSPLFQEFRLDEPWDSPHNKALLERMPAYYAIPGSRAEPGMTFYRGFSGESTLFDLAVPDGVELAKILDGPQNTISVVEAREAVPWTRPDSDIPFKAEAQNPATIQPLLDALGGHQRGGFHALFCDGSVKFLRDSINPIILHALITRDRGEVVASDSF